MACEACGDDVIAGRRAALLARASPIHAAIDDPRDEFYLPPAARPSFQRAAAALKRELHARFWRHHTGRITRVRPHPFGH